MKRACWVSVLGLVCALGVAGCGQSANPVEPGPVRGVSGTDAAAAGGAAGSQSGVLPSESGGSSMVNKGLAEIRQATAAFHDVNAAIAAGYADPATGPCDSSPDGIMGVHAANQALIGDGEIEPLKPEVLLYLPIGNGNFRLIGVEYLQPVLLRNPETGAVQPWFDQSPWPPSWTVVNPTPSVLGQTFDGPMPGHVPGMPWHWDLHAWIWAPNPSGMFAQWNPRLGCPAEGGE